MKCAQDKLRIAAQNFANDGISADLRKCLILLVTSFLTVLVPRICRSPGKTRLAFALDKRTTIYVGIDRVLLAESTQRGSLLAFNINPARLHFPFVIKTK